MLTKEKLIESLRAMPEEVFEDIDVLFEQIIILNKVESGIKDVEEGNIISHDDMKKVIDAWFQK